MPPLLVTETSPDPAAATVMPWPLAAMSPLLVTETVPDDAARLTEMPCLSVVPVIPAAILAVLLTEIAPDAPVPVWTSAMPWPPDVTAPLLTIVASAPACRSETPVEPDPGEEIAPEFSNLMSPAVVVEKAVLAKTPMLSAPDAVMSPLFVIVTSPVPVLASLMPLASAPVTMMSPMFVIEAAPAAAAPTMLRKRPYLPALMSPVFASVFAPRPLLDW